MKPLDEDKAQQEVDEYINAHFDPRAADLWAIIQKHAQPPPPKEPSDQ